jgi:hypothetical protein
MLIEIVSKRLSILREEMAAKIKVVLMALVVTMEKAIETNFKQSEIIPVVSRLIDEGYNRRKDYIGRTDLVNAFIADHRGGLLADLAWKRYEQENRQKPNTKWQFLTKTKLFGNMIDWFSARYGRGDPQLISNFKRVKVSNY